MTRAARAWDPWQQLERLQNEMNRVFSDFGRPSLRFGAEYPPVNLWQSDEGLMLTAEVPGLDLEDLDITVQGATVTIKGNRKPETLQEGDTFHRRERPAEPFARTVELPFEVNSEATEATYEKGVLTLKMSRPEEQKPRKVTVKAG